jgi:hypothetical protein
MELEPTAPTEEENEPNGDIINDKHIHIVAFVWNIGYFVFNKYRIFF